MRSSPQLATVLSAVLLGAAALVCSACVDADPVACHGEETHPSCDEPSDSSGGQGAGGSDAGSGGADAAPERARVVGYLPTYRSLDPDRVNWSTLTHLCIAFANPGPIGGSDEPTFNAEDSTIEALVAAAHAADVQVLASIAGAGGGSERVAARIVPDKVDAFVAALEDLVERFDLDGIDVDVEGTQHVGSTYEPFVLKLGAALRERGKLMTSAVGLWYAQNITNAALAEFDFINVMSYDHCGSWSAEPCEHSSMTSARSDINYWVATRGYPAGRTVLGVPFYGYCWGPDCPGAAMTYADIVATWPEASGQDWIEEAGLTVSYNGEATIRSKVKLGRQHGGVMIWELAQDAAGDASLLSVIDEEL